MLVTTLELRDFRTYALAEARLGPGLTVVHGANGAGKSNLLEALYFGCTGRSPRTRNDRELVSFGAPATRVTVSLLDGREPHRLTVGFGAGEDGQSVKRMTCDGAPVERLLEIPVRPLISVFMPERLELVKGPPAVRRAHLDQVLAALWPARAAVRREYSRALAQRNALLARIRSGRSSSDAALGAWDSELATAALELRDRRAELVALLAPPFAARARELGLTGTPLLEYRPRSRAADPREFVAELAARLAGDLERGFTGHGPHRDELALLRDGRELRVYGSQGEQRLALLALLLAERSLLAEVRGTVPLMLLDDVMSELDADRRRLLSAELSAAGQSVIATTDLAHVPGGDAATVARLAVSPGAVLQEALAA